MKNEPLVTVVIPIYNTEPYIDRCIESVIRQTYRLLEILLVDDGSTDNCPRICEDYATRDPRIRVIHKKNEGLGMARNTGIDQATGAYICFFDSDDYVEPDTIEVCVAVAVEQQADEVIFGYSDVTASGATVRTHIPHTPRPLFVGAQITAELLPMALYTNQGIAGDWEVPLSACNKLFSLAAIRDAGWRFVSEREIISEDFYSLTELHGHLRRVCILDRVFYHYTVNPTSLSRSYRPDRFARIQSFYEAMISLSEKMELGETLLQPIKAVTFGLIIGAMKQIVAAELNFKQRYRELRRMVKDGFLQELIRTTEYSGVGVQKKLLYQAARYKLAWLCFLMVYLKNKRNA